MKLIEFVGDEDAVSPVIGVILMVAITVILAAVIGTFVLGLGGQTETAPQASFSFDKGAGNTVTITHESGESIPTDSDTVEVTGDIALPGPWTPSDSELSAGDSTDVNLTSTSGGEVIRVVWTSESGSTSSTLQKWTYNG